MRKISLAFALLPFVISSPAAASVVADPAGDILGTFTGTPSDDLDVTSFSVDFNGSAFFLQAVFAGNIDPATGALYIIGVDTGTGPIAPFADIGNPNVTFNQVIIVNGATGAGSVSGNALTPTISGNMFSLSVPLAFLPSTGAQPGNYGFNIWPRVGLGNNNQISDFAPNNALLSSVPEPAAWLTMLLGFGLIGTALRFRRRPEMRQAA